MNIHTGETGPGDTIGPPVPQRVQRWIEQQPERVALVSGTRTLTYRQLGAEAGALADTLRARGVGRGSIVGLCLERSTELITAALAVLTAGGAYLALDPAQPPQRSRRMLTESGAKLLLTRGGAGKPFAPLATDILDLDEPGAGQPGDERAPALTVTGDDLAYVNYTSGSSGQPKGVLVGHRGLANLVDWYQEAYQVTAQDRMTQLARPSFDAFALEVWPCLASGAALDIVEPALLRSPADLVAWLTETRVTTMFVPTPLAEELLDLPWPRRDDGAVALRTMLVGGDRLSRRPPAGLPFRLYNNYGPTEYTVVATWAETEPAAGADLPPIGQPIRNTVAYVLDEQRRPVGPGAVGELYLAGAGLARGYLGDPDLTEARFPADPFTPGARMYATGDLVRRSADGTLHFCGRTDDQVKIRGFRIEPAEVEAALLEDAAVRSATVVAHRRPAGGPELLVGYVVAPGADGEMLRKRVAGLLPDYLVPATVVVLNALPVTSHGKIDRAQLRALPLDQETGPADAAVEPDADEAELIALWREVLGLEQIERDQNFFDIGGDSLRVIRLVSRARRRGITMRPEDIHEHPVLSDFLDVLRGKNRAP